MKFIIASTTLLFAPLLSYAHPGHSEHTPLTLIATTSPQVSIRTDEHYRYIHSNAIPSHSTGTFPNRGNPHGIRAQDFDYRMPLHPSTQAEPIQTRAVFGVAINGVGFDPSTAEFWNNDRRSGWNYEALSGRIHLGLDHNNAHVQRTGTYHYHGIPHALNDSRSMTLIGWAADGFPIYGPEAYSQANDSSSPLRTMKPSYRIKTGTRPDGPGGSYDGTFTQDYQYVEGLGDLDACNGRYGVTPQYPQGTYYYVLTEDFPHIARMFRGQPDDSFLKKGGSRSPRHRSPSHSQPSDKPTPHRGPPPHQGPPPPQHPLRS